MIVPNALLGPQRCPLDRPNCDGPSTTATATARPRPNTSPLPSGTIEKLFTDEASNVGINGERICSYSVRLRATQGSIKTPTPNDITAWGNTFVEPTQAELFGTATPANNVCLVQRYETSEPVDPNKPPILLGAGTGDNPLRAFRNTAKDYAAEGFPVYFLTPNHPNNSPAVVAEQMSIASQFVAREHGGRLPIFDCHSALNFAFEILVRLDMPGFREALEARGLFVPSSPLPDGLVKIIHRGHAAGGEDAVAAFGALGFNAISPSRATNAAIQRKLLGKDLSATDTNPNNSPDNVFPGAGATLARQSKLPPVIQAGIEAAWDPFNPRKWAAFATFAVQPDSYTNYEGGRGFISESPGIDQAAEEAGGLVELLRQFPTDGDHVERHAIYGTNPYGFNGVRQLVEESIGETRTDLLFLASDLFSTSALTPAGALTANAWGISQSQLQSLMAGGSIAGDLREGDGLVTVGSALALEQLGEVKKFIPVDAPHIVLTTLGDATAREARLDVAEAPLLRPAQRVLVEQAESFNPAKYAAENLVE